MTGHTTCNGVNGVFDFRAVGSQFIGEFLDEVLSLSDSHTVTGYDYDFFRRFKLRGVIGFYVGRFFRFRIACGGFLLFRRFCGRCGRSAEQDRTEFAVHGFAHNLCEEQTACADDTADGDQQQVVDSQTCDCARNAAKAVEKRNRNGHIRAAYSYCKNETEERRKQRHEGNKEADGRLYSHSDGYAIADDTEKRHGEAEHSQKLMSPVNDGFLRQNLVKFAGGDEAAQ